MFTPAGRLVPLHNCQQPQQHQHVFAMRKCHSTGKWLRQPLSEGLERACGERGVAMHTPCPGRSSHTGQSTEQVKMWSSLFGSSLQRLKGKHCHPMPCTRGLMGGAGSFGAVSPAQRSMPQFLCQWQQCETCLLQSHISKP